MNIRTLLGKGKEGFDRKFILPTSTMEAVNEFLTLFARSEAERVRFSESDLHGPALGLLEPLSDEEYSTICNRLRIISALDPVRNQKENEGLIRFGLQIDGEVREFRFRLIFAPSQRSITLMKTGGPKTDP